jgi:hypothetical protein
MNLLVKIDGLKGSMGDFVTSQYDLMETSMFLPLTEMGGVEGLDEMM